MTCKLMIVDVIVLDLLMPHMGGDQLRSVLQRHPKWSRIPIIVCTGDLVPDDVRTSVFGVLQKPFDLDRLFSMVKKACGCEL